MISPSAADLLYYLDRPAIARQLAACSRSYSFGAKKSVLAAKIAVDIMNKKNKRNA